MYIPAMCDPAWHPLQATFGYGSGHITGIAFNFISRFVVQVFVGQAKRPQSVSHRSYASKFKALLGGEELTAGSLKLTYSHLTVCKKLW